MCMYVCVFVQYIYIYYVKSLNISTLREKNIWKIEDIYSVSINIIFTYTNMYI